MFAAGADVARVADVAFAADGAADLHGDQLGETDDGVERRAQLVAHIGQERRLGAVGLFGRVLRLDDRNLALLLLADIARLDRKSTRLNSSHLGISYAVFCLKKKTQTQYQYNTSTYIC